MMTPEKEEDTCSLVCGTAPKIPLATVLGGAPVWSLRRLASLRTDPAASPTLHEAGLAGLPALLCQIGSGKWGRISALARTSSASRLAGVGVFARTARRAPAELAGQRHGPLAERNRRSDKVVLGLWWVARRLVAECGGGLPGVTRRPRRAAASLGTLPPHRTPTSYLTYGFRLILFPGIHFCLARQTGTRRRVVVHSASSVVVPADRPARLLYFVRQRFGSNR